MEKVALDRAYRLKNGVDTTAGVESVDSDWLRSVGSAAAKLHRYICVERSCGIELSPVFPHKKRKDGSDRKIHFGARSGLRTHIGHGSIVHVGNPPDTSTTALSGSNPPVEWKDKLDRKTEIAGGEEAELEESAPDRVRETGSRTGRQGASSVSTLSRLVEAWSRSEQAGVDSPFHMPSSKAETLRELFSECGENPHLGFKDRRVWMGYIEKIRILGSQGVVLYVSGSDGRLFQSNRIDFDQAARDQRPDLWRMVWRAQKHSDVYAYVLGYRNAEAKSLRVEAAHHFWLVRK